MVNYPDNNIHKRKEFSLRELNSLVREVMTNAFPTTCWVRGEMSDVRTNASSGHCYLELIEKDALSGQLVARARASIWAKTFRMLKPYFEMETSQPFVSGIKVLVKVSVDFHELYGYSLTILDIDPTYTLGDMARRRQEIIRRLQEEGVYTLNKELELPTPAQRIAIITSPTAAGYEDFMNQLEKNNRKYVFYTRLFPAIMQGEKTEGSIIAALEQIYRHMDKFDLVVIIRGGGATSDLNSFDSYLLAANCAQFPLPVITGIGHERDDTIVDLVAHTRMKTPTAVAEFLLEQADREAVLLEHLQDVLHTRVNELLHTEQNFLQLTASRLPGLVSGQLQDKQKQLQVLAGKLPFAARSRVIQEQNRQQVLLQRIRTACDHTIREEEQFLQLAQQFIRLASPDYILQRGYSITLQDGKIIKKASQLRKGEQITTRFQDGDIESQVI
ncbi:MAG: exodeoxyribonuclease VII large subunit [Tannerellaceae bacterium]|nr:exodeoxyribonuclease VII large subunit [Tannerellaceae bacterium]